MTNTNPIIYATEKGGISGKYVLYFDGGDYVYSSGYNSVVRYNVEIEKGNEEVDSVVVRLKYIEGEGEEKESRSRCYVVSKGNEITYVNDRSIFSREKMRIKEVNILVYGT